MNSVNTQEKINDNIKTANTQKKSINKKTVIAIATFIGFIVLCFVGGYVAGRIAAHYDIKNLDLSSFWESFNLTAAYALPWINLVLWLSVTVFSIVCIVKGKKLFASWDGENEKVIEKAESLLGIALCVLNVADILYLFFLGAVIYFDDAAGGPLSKLDLILFLILYLAGIISTLVFQRIIVELEKKINPEKKGELMSTKFQKDWLNSFDEAEKMMMYKATFKAFRATNTLCLILWILCVVGILTFNTGILPIVIVTIIWFVNTIAYQVECIKLEKRK